jgi:hypothetical protein
MRQLAPRFHFGIRSCGAIVFLCGALEAER